jgi:hypothetical protein
MSNPQVFGLLFGEVVVLQYPYEYALFSPCIFPS